MALHDLTPQLRTRLSRLEKVVGWFVTIATLLLIGGLAYYIYTLAERKGWFLKKMPYFTFVRNATGLTVGDRVKLMGFDVGEITEVTAEPPNEFYNVYIQFRVKEPYYGYLWEDSVARVGAADFLGHRFIEVTKGSNGPPTYALHDVKELSITEAFRYANSNGFGFAEPIHIGTNRVVYSSEPVTPEKLRQLQALNIKTVQLIYGAEKPKAPKWVWDDKAGRYTQITNKLKGYWLHAEESPALTERLETVVNTVEAALPNFLGLTNKLTQVLTNANGIFKHADEILVSAKPILTNFAQISANLSGPKGTLGEWILPTNINAQLQTTLAAASGTMTSAQTNLNVLSTNILSSLENLANLTSNLNAQVQANGLILYQLSELVVHSDELVQGLKRNWLLKSSFDQKTNQPPQSIVKPRVGGAP
jgi:hypothetical protein